MLFLIIGAASYAATIAASASATIVYPIAVSTVTNLAFGSLATNETGGTVTITADGRRLAGSGVDVIPASAFTAAAFLINGQPHTAYVVSIPTSAMISHGSDQMLIDNFTASATTGTLDSIGQQNLTIGGTLHMAPRQPLGSYMGLFNVTVTYN